jgi:hypothetical protein
LGRCLEGLGYSYVLGWYHSRFLQKAILLASPNPILPCSDFQQNLGFAVDKVFCILDLEQTPKNREFNEPTMIKRKIVPDHHLTLDYDIIPNNLISPSSPLNHINIAFLLVGTFDRPRI